MKIRSNLGRARRYGFSLLELSLVLMVVGVLIGVGVSSMRQPLESAAIAATNQRLLVIRDALKAYKDLNGRLPCPADPSIAAGASGYGEEIGVDGTCMGDGVRTADSVAEGGIPFAELGLPAQYTYDGWKRRFVYAVYMNATRTNAFYNYGPYTTSDEGIDVQDASGSNRNTSVDKYIYLLMSHGKNGHGAYNRSGTRFNNSSTNTSEQLNCHCNASAVATAYTPTYIDREATSSSTDPNDVFDDVLLYQTFSHLRSASDNNIKGSLPTHITQSVDTPIDAGNPNFASSSSMGDVNGDGYMDVVLGMPNGDNGGADSGSIFVLFGTARGIPKDWELTSLDATKIIRFDGSAAGMKIGTTMGVADVNSDGYADIITSAINGANYEVYVVYGKRIYASATNVITQGGGGSYIDGTHGYLLTSAYFSTPNSIVIGELNGDGLNDIIISSSAYNSGSVYGTVVVVFGTPAGWASTNTVNAAFLNGRRGTLVSSTTNIGFGTAAAVGDVNGDGWRDLAIGAPGADNGAANTGSVYVLFGRDKWLPSYTEASLTSENTSTTTKAWGTITFSANPVNNSTITLNSVTWTFVTSGAAGNQTNISATLAETLASLYTDLNASGAGGLTIANYSVSSTVLKVTCKTSDTACDSYGLARSAAPASNGTVSAVDLTDYATAAVTSPPSGLRFDGEIAADGLGSALGTGDINGDGTPDLVMGASTRVVSGDADTGAIFVVFGKTDWTSFANTLNAAFLNAGAVGVRFDSPIDGGFFGRSFVVGDINNNSYADIFAPTYTGGDNEIYIVLGQSSYAAANYTLESTSPFDMVNGTTLMKYISNITSTRVSPALGDINGDGLVDMVFAAPNY